MPYLQPNATPLTLTAERDVPDRLVGRVDRCRRRAASRPRCCRARRAARTARRWLRTIASRVGLLRDVGVDVDAPRSPIAAAAVASPASSLTSVRTTLAPSAANSSDATLPMPLPPPVISATLPSKRIPSLSDPPRRPSRAEREAYDHGVGRRTRDLRADPRQRPVQVGERHLLDPDRLQGRGVGRPRRPRAASRASRQRSISLAAALAADVGDQLGLARHRGERRADRVGDVGVLGADRASARRGSASGSRHAAAADRRPGRPRRWRAACRSIASATARVGVRRARPRSSRPASTASRPRSPPGRPRRPRP